jgi:hypothetical protein
MGKRFGRKASQERRAQQNPRYHLADHSRLTDAVKRDAKQVRRRQHNTDLEKQQMKGGNRNRITCATRRKLEPRFTLR